MKQVTQNFRNGEIKVEDVPFPEVGANSVLVRTHFSLLSTGTEGGTVRLAKQSMIGKARARPDLVRKVIKTVRTQGLVTTYQAITGQLDMPLAHGYSASGTVIGVGEDVSDMQVGDRVSCFGAGHASHAEVIAVPRNLVAPVPDNVSLRDASFGALGTIALNGVRRAEVQLGENVLVIGLGLLGLLTVQLLSANGCRVAGVDLDPRKVELASQLGLDLALIRDKPNAVEAITAFARGVGVDAVIITAFAPNNDPVVLAGQVARPGGRVVAVGRVDYELPRDDFLFKQLDFRTAFNSGAGVNDFLYEEHGIDYPIDQVRWTMNRNVIAFNDLLASNRLSLDALVTHEYPLENAVDAYELLSSESDELNVGIVITYDTEKSLETSPISVKPSRKPPTGQVGVGVIGAGNFASTFLIPEIASYSRGHLRGIASNKGVRSQNAAEKHGFAFAGTAEQVLSDSDTDVVFIATRHDTHAPLTIAALEAGKDVFVEKPLAMTHDELDAVIDAQAKSGGRVLVGHNRRFSAYASEMRQRFETRGQPISIIYRYNPGPINPKSWIRDPVLGGGRIIGEGCHFIDFCQFLAGSPPIQVFTQSLHSPHDEIREEEHVMINVSYADGSMAVIAYLSGGDGSYTQERVEAYADGTVAVMEDWRSLEFSRNGRVDKKRSGITNDKGFQSEVHSYLDAIADGSDAPFSFDDYILSMRTTLLAMDSLRENKPLKI